MRPLLPAILAIILGCTKPTPSLQRAPSGLLKGFAISPRGFPLTYEKLPDFFTEVGQLSNGAVLWNGAWRDDAESGTDAGTIPAAATAIQQYSPTHHFTPVPVFGWRAGTTLYIKIPTNLANDWSNPDAKSAFVSMLTQYATTQHPPYLFLGNENDIYYEQTATGYTHWITVYNAAYDAIKSASPSTQVGPVFNVEHVSGSGTLNGWTTPYFEAIEAHDFSKIDLVGLTVYPFLNHAQAASVPSTYLDAVMAHIHNKPIAITETGWPAENLVGPSLAWEASETAQATYLTRLQTLMTGKNVSFVMWLFLHQQVDPGTSPLEWKLFASVSLRNTAGKERPAYSSWRAFQIP